MSPFSRTSSFFLLPLLAVLAACSSTPQKKFQDEELFNSGTSPYLHNFDNDNARTCEAARRALLSQGYMTTMTRPDTVDATKNFQPASDSHVVIEFHVVCTQGDATNTSVVYANAVQNGYELKKSDTSASVGLSILGSLSLPIRSNNDAMVKVSSETIQSGTFYDRFFDLVSRYLHSEAQSTPVPGGAIDVTPLPPPLVQHVTVPVAVPVAMPVAAAAAPVAASAAKAAAASVETTAPGSVSATQAAASGSTPANVTVPGSTSIATSNTHAANDAATHVANSGNTATTSSIAAAAALMGVSATTNSAAAATATPAAVPLAPAAPAANQ